MSTSRTIDDSAGRDEATSPDTRQRRRTVVLLLAALVLTGVAAQRAYTWKAFHDQDEARREAVDAASAEVAGLISISNTTSESDLTTLLDGATAEFREDLQSQADRLRSELKKNDVDADGSTVSAGLSAFDDDSATVIVAASGTVDNNQTATPEPRNYRLKVTLVKKGERWLVSGLEFVA